MGGRKSGEVEEDGVMDEMGVDSLYVVGVLRW